MDGATQVIDGEDSGWLVDDDDGKPSVIGIKHKTDVEKGVGEETITIGERDW